MQEDMGHCPEENTAPAAIMLRRIGRTTYQVAIHFSNTSKETISDKIMRLSLNEAGQDRDDMICQ